MDFVKDTQSIKAAQEGDEEALSRIVESNMGLIKNAARRFLGRGTDMEDLVQIGAIGMIKAVRRFDLSSGLSLTTYAVPMIVGEIRRFLRDDGLVKVSRSAKTNHAKILAFCSQYRNHHAKEPSLAQIAEELGITEEEVIYAQEANQPILSLFSERREGDVRPEDFLGEDSMDDRFDSLALEEALHRLPPPQQRLIRLRYFKQLTQNQTAKLMGLTQVKVCREEKKICELLRKELSF